MKSLYHRKRNLCSSMNYKYDTKTQWIKIVLDCEGKASIFHENRYLHFVNVK